MADDETIQPQSPDEMAERLDELERKIEEVRHQAEEDDLLDNPNEPRLYEPGSIQPEQDDQEIGGAPER